MPAHKTEQIPSKQRAGAVGGIAKREASRHQQEAAGLSVGMPLHEAGGTVKVIMPARVAAAPQRHRGVVVAPRLLLGSQRTPLDAGFLSSHRVSHVLCVASELPCEAAGDVDQHHVDISEPVADNEDTATKLDTAISWACDAIDGGGGVLVYCRRGLNRSASVVAGALMRQQSLSADAAIDVVCKAQRKANPCKALVALLRRRAAVSRA